MEKPQPSQRAPDSKTSTSGLGHDLPRIRSDEKVKRAKAISQRALANLLKGARAGGFVPYEIVLGATGEVRLMAEPNPSSRGGKPNDFDREFG